MGEILEIVRAELDGTKREDLPMLPTFDTKPVTPNESTAIIDSVDTTAHPGTDTQESMDTAISPADTSNLTSSSSSSSDDDHND